jgi:uncharacterized protein YggE
MFRFAILAAVTFAVLASGCSVGDTTVIDSSKESPGITVTGEGSVFGTPDIAVVTLGADATAATVADARSQAGQSMDAMLKALKDGGVADKDVQTTSFTVQPQYGFSKQQQTLTGFIVSNVATVKIHNIDKTGELIDAAVGAGGNSARVNSLQFTIDDPATLESQARVKAMAQAKSRAATLAKAGGLVLGKPRSISEGGAATPITFSGSVPGGLAAAGTPIQVGQLEVQISVSVVYGLN